MQSAMWLIEREVFGSDHDLKLMGALAHRGIEFREIYVDRRGIPQKLYSMTKGRTTIFRGSIETAASCDEASVSPGVFRGDFSYDRYISGQGSLMFNSDAIFTTIPKIGEIALSFGTELVFCRPIADDKTFAGLILDARSIQGYVDRMVNSGYIEDPSIPVMVAPGKEFFSEWRVVVDGTVVTMCMDSPITMETGTLEAIGKSVEAFVTRCDARWKPAKIYVIDVVNTPHGHRIMEYNCFNTASWKNCNYDAIIDAIEGSLAHGW